MSSTSPPRLIIVWTLGAVLGTLLIAFTSPLFVRSYLPRNIDSTRGAPAMPAGSTFRWRSEGYANTKIGPLGMPGKTTLGDPGSGALRVALWGDSQAEGVCVDDNEKLFARIEQMSGGSIEVFPLARSGDDVSSWIRQMRSVERELAIDTHVLLVVDLDDLQMTQESTSQPIDVAVVAYLPAFLIQATRNLVTDHDTGSIRRLRFAVGPAERLPTEPSGSDNSQIDWQGSLRQLRDSTRKPILILYAPPSPQIVSGQERFNDENAEQFARIESAGRKLQIRTINGHQAQCESATAGRWPHGFHNGQIGSGHLNAEGNRVLAQMLVDVLGGEAR